MKESGNTPQREGAEMSRPEVGRKCLFLRCLASHRCVTLHVRGLPRGEWEEMSGEHDREADGQKGDSRGEEAQ
jgi:hypothetical protein